MMYNVPSEIKMELLAADCTTLEDPSWLSLADYEILDSEGLGTTLSVTGHAAVSGRFGDGEIYSIGGSIGLSWTADKTEVLTHTISTSKSTKGSYRYLGYVTCDVDEGYGDTQRNWGIVMLMGIPNGPAHDRDGDWFFLWIKVTMTFQKYSMFWPYPKVGTESYTNSFVINGDPSTDLYLLETQDYTHTIG